MLSDIMLIVAINYVMLSFSNLSVIMINVTQHEQHTAYKRMMLNAVVLIAAIKYISKLNVVMLNVILLIVAAPFLFPQEVRVKSSKIGNLSNGLFT